jgi:hypothetical protein
MSERPNPQTWESRSKLAQDVAELIHAYCWDSGLGNDHLLEQHETVAEAIIDELIPWETL